MRLLFVIVSCSAAESAYLRERICAFVLGADAVPVNPWMMGGYFLYGLRGLAAGGPRWARNLFLLSILYLPVLFAALVLDGVQ